MKNCPTCQNAYPDDFSLCPRDGATLVETGAWIEGAVVRGKTKMQALVATMRKLLHAIYGMFKHNQPFDGQKVYAALVPAPASEPKEVLCI